MNPARSTPLAKRLESPVQLLVEGKTAEQFTNLMLDHMKIDNIEVQDFGGVNELSKFIRVFVKQSGFASVRILAIARDAETSSTAAGQSISSAFKNAGFPGFPRVPSTLSPLAKSHSKLRGGYFVFASTSNPRNGMLESLCLESLGHDPLLACVDEFLACAEPRLRKSVTDKNRCAAYLSAKSPDLRVGNALGKIWPPDSKAFAAYRGFLDLLQREASRGPRQT